MDEEDQYDGRDRFDYRDRYETRERQRARGRYECCERRDELTRFNLKLDISDFEGKMELNDFLDWLSMLEQVFDYCDPINYKNMKLVVIKLLKHTSFWWENLKRHREREHRSRIITWKKMKRELKRKYLSQNYRQDIAYLEAKGLECGRLHC